MKRRFQQRYGWIVAAALTAAGAALAADPPKAAPADPGTEQRKAMAEAHRKMAMCLESERPYGECRAEMQKRCHELMGSQGCPMMGPMGPTGHGGMHGGMQREKTAD